jgi:hypothetical protein
VWENNIQTTENYKNGIIAGQRIIKQYVGE